MSCRVLITGGSGLVGRYLLKSVPDGYEIGATYHTNKQPGCEFEMDIRDASSVFYVFNVFQPDIVIHTAAQGSVDWCERNEKEAHWVNVEGTKRVWWAARELGAKVVFLSSNAVFDGENAPYAENDRCVPVNAYGRTKSKAELCILGDFRCPYLILRPILFYGIPWTRGRSNWATKVLRAQLKRTPLKIVDDTITMPMCSALALPVRTSWNTASTFMMGRAKSQLGASSTAIAPPASRARRWEMASPRPPARPSRLE